MRLFSPRSAIYDEGMVIRVEFFGIARKRAGAAACQLELSRRATLGDCLEALAARFPAIAADCIDQGALKPAFAANVNGQAFVRDPCTAIPEGATLLILSADAGG
jgi:molybdopterin converting factor small subunit